MSARRFKGPKPKGKLISGPFVPLQVAMIASPAWAALNLPARRILDRLQIENAHHGGEENGRLVVTFDQFVAAGVRRMAIAPAIRLLCRLGFLEITYRGGRSFGQKRTPSAYRLTYLNTGSRRAGWTTPTNEWECLTEEHVAAILHKLDAGEDTLPVRIIDRSSENATRLGVAKTLPEKRPSSSENATGASSENATGEKSG